MAKMNTQAWDIADSLDRLRSDFIRDFIRNGEPADLKESLTEFTEDLKKLATRCERIADNVSAKKGRGGSEGRIKNNP